MGLILFGAILVLFYVAKIFFPEWIVGVAEIPSIVAFGNFVDSHYLITNAFDILVTCTVGYLYFCACCRTYKLNLKCLIVLISHGVLLSLVSIFAPLYYTPINYVLLVFTPLLMCWINKNITKATFISTAMCFTVDILTQYMSLFIRDITVYANTLNTATFFILLIDAVIWRVLLYCYFNYKKES